MPLGRNGANDNRDKSCQENVHAVGCLVHVWNHHVAFEQDWQEVLARGLLPCAHVGANRPSQTRVHSRNVTEETRWLMANPKNLVIVKHVGKTGRERGLLRKHGDTRK